MSPVRAAAAALVGALLGALAGLGARAPVVASVTPAHRSTDAEVSACVPQDRVQALERSTEALEARARGSQSAHRERLGSPFPALDRRDEVLDELEGLEVVGLSCDPLPCRAAIELHGVPPDVAEARMASFRRRFPGAYLGWEEVGRPPAAGVMPFVLSERVEGEDQLTRLRYWMLRTTDAYYAETLARGEIASPGAWPETPGAIPAPAQPDIAK